MMQQLRAVAFQLLFVGTPLVLLPVRGQTIRVDRVCYPRGEDFVISYSGADAVDDWIALVPAATALSRSNNEDTVFIPADDDVSVWSWKCDSMPCRESSGTVSVPNTLPLGEYVAVLAHSADQAPYQGFATSSVLTVAGDCTGPGPAPMAQVTPRTPTVRTRPMTNSPVAAEPPERSNDNVAAAQDLANARSMLAAMIADDADLAPKFLRLVFHDCIGGCDGCVDLTNPDNFGLKKPIDALERVFEQHGDTVSRADLWALGAAVAVDAVQSSHDKIDFPFTFWGREDCTLRASCTGNGGQSVPCTPKFGPHHEHPSIHLNTADLYHFFASEFGLSAREAIVAMAGGHTIGVLSVPNSGINGPNGWVPNNRVFDKEYFDEVIGGTTPDAPIDVLVNEAPAWRRKLDPPSGVFQNRRVWEGFPTPTKRILMLNTDIALFRDLNPSNYDDKIGQVRCAFEDDTSRVESIPKCPHVEAAVLIGAELKHDNVQFKTEFRAVLVKLLSIGYERVACNDDVCKLSKR